MTERAPTERPKSWGGWVIEVVTLFVIGTVIAAVLGVLWAIHMREIRVLVERANCAQVVFSADGQRWYYEPELDQCQLFTVGAQWVIGVNEIGAVRPVRKE